MSGGKQIHFENATPILRVEDMAAAVKYYVEVLGFVEADWGNDKFSNVSRDEAGIYLVRGEQGHPGTWVWVGVSDAQALYEEYQAKGARLHHAPRNYSWALEMHVEDLDGNILRFGSDPLKSRPYEEWMV
jgi:catechol 2,3-dioxygenase-like lactoylglutathione lyase family enzyme